MLVVFASHVHRIGIVGQLGLLSNCCLMFDVDKEIKKLFTEKMGKDYIKEYYNAASDGLFTLA